MTLEFYLIKAYMTPLHNQSSGILPGKLLRPEKIDSQRLHAQGRQKIHNPKSNKTNIKSYRTDYS
jgi:hypothetical protein